MMKVKTSAFILAKKMTHVADEKDEECGVLQNWVAPSSYNGAASYLIFQPGLSSAPGNTVLAFPYTVSE